MNKMKFLLTPKFVGVPYDILSAEIANAELNEAIRWSFINECNTEVMMSSIKVLNGEDILLVSNACGGGYESCSLIENIGDNFNIEEVLKDEYGQYKIKDIY